MKQDMHLLVDIGNSRIKWSFQPHNLKPSNGHTSNSHSSDNAELTGATNSATWDLKNIESCLDKHWGNFSTPVTKVTISNVAGNHVQETLSQWCEQSWKITPQFAETTKQFGAVKNGYDQFQELGVDRWLAVIAAHKLYPESTNIVLDCGSAITVDTILSNGQHLPGPIIPGYNALLNTLASKTAFAADGNERVADDDLQAVVTSTIFVTSSHSAVMSGVNYAISKSLDAIVGEISQQLELRDKEQASETIASEGTKAPSPIKLIVTGGAAEFVMPLTRLKDYLTEPDLVLKGLKLYFDH